MVALLGIEGTAVWLAYVLCILSTLLCVAYGLLNWNKGEEPLQEVDVKWAAEEKKVEQEL